MEKYKVKLDFEGKGSHSPIKILRKVTGFNTNKNDIYIANYSGLVSVIHRRSSNEIAQAWNKKFIHKNKKKIFNTKKYTSNVPFVKSRLLNALFTANDFKSLKNKNIVDLGCGEGTLLLEATKRYKSKVYGVDPSKRNCKEMTKKKLKAFCYTAEEFCNNKKFSSKFNVCFITWTLCNSSDCNKIVEGARKILKKDGLIVIAESSRIMTPFKKSIFDYFTRKKKVDLHPFHFSFNSINNLLVINNFKVMFKNYFFTNNELIVIGQKKKFVSNNNLKRDNPKSVMQFFQKWYDISKYYKLFQ